MSKAEAGGWVALCTYAIGGEDVVVQSILLRVQRGPVAMSGYWTGPPGAVDSQGRPTGLGFDGAWRRDGNVTRRVTYGQLAHYLTDPGTEPAPTAAALARAAEIAEREQEEMLVAIAVAMDVLEASLVRVHSQGGGGDWCRGHVIQGQPIWGSRRVSCTRPAVPGTPYCEGPCERV